MYDRSLIQNNDNYFNILNHLMLLSHCVQTHVHLVSEFRDSIPLPSARIRRIFEQNYWSGNVHLASHLKVVPLEAPTSLAILEASKYEEKLVD